MRVTYLRASAISEHNYITCLNQLSRYINYVTKYLCYVYMFAKVVKINRDTNR